MCIVTVTTKRLDLMLVCLPLRRLADYHFHAVCLSVCEQTEKVMDGFSDIWGIFRLRS